VKTMVDSLRGLIGDLGRGVGIFPALEPWHEKTPERKRKASLPFISGDTYRSMADVVIETPKALKRLRDSSFIDSLTNKRLFTKSDIGLVVAQSIPVEIAQQCDLVINNGGFNPLPELEDVSRNFRRVGAVHWLGSRTYVEPLPLGINNVCRGGNLSMFLDCHPDSRPDLFLRRRKVELLVAFSDETNFEERKLARNTALTFRGRLFAPNSLDLSSYHKYLRDSLFVLSPPGGGPDCFRTWEAIYAGAVPIVLRKAWNLDHMNLPVLSVDSFEEGVALLEKSPQDLYHRITSTKTGCPFFSCFWQYFMSRSFPG
jgi:hypothetical protein